MRNETAKVGPASEMDLTWCEQEPIHVPGAIQPHGLLFAFTETDLRAVSVSANLPDFAGLRPEAVIGTPLDRLFDAASRTRLPAALGQAEGTAGTPFSVRFAHLPETRLDGLVHRHDGLGILELETAVDEDDDVRSFFGRTNGAIKRLQAARTLTDACAAAARELRRITGFDRVDVYRFAADFSGEVIAESRTDTMNSFLGLHFPASDIPARARALYRLNPLRIIPDIGYTPVAIVPGLNPRTGHPIDLTYAVLRSVSPVHLEYMRNMGISSTFSVSILRGDRLWGLMACHHRQPRHVGQDARQACEMVGQVLAWHIGVLEEEAVSRVSLRGQAIQRRLMSDIDQFHDHRASLIRHSGALLDLMGASGLCLYGRDTATTIGGTPPHAAITRLVEWIGQADGPEPFQTDRLSALLPEAAGYANIASGVLAVPLSRSPSPRWMLWFRPEESRTVRWAGNPDKPVVPGLNGGRPQPRQSFAAWAQQSRGRAVPWQAHEITAAVEIRELIIDVILRKAEALERANSQLSRSNEELESFAYVASHDLKEPLRHIEAFAGLLAEPIRLTGDERLNSMIGGIESSSRRLRNLINDLAEFSRLGRPAQPPTLESLQDILQDVIASMRQRIEESSANVACGTLPVVRCDRIQMHQVLQNLLSNALKYRDPGRPCQIRIAAAPDNADRRSGGDFVRICVSDNGIGFDPKYANQVFEPFQRLHGPDQYQGSGIGLAICRKVIHRHGGEVGVETEPGNGATFWFTLPVAAETNENTGAQGIS